MKHRQSYHAGVFRLATWTHWSEHEIRSMPVTRLLTYLKLTEVKE